MSKSLRKRRAELRRKRQARKMMFIAIGAVVCLLIIMFYVFLRE